MTDANLDFGNTTATSNYVGAAWRSRFLRAPKIALELAAREDFVALEDLANVRLGLKTGADDFFFLERLSRSESVGQLIPRRGMVEVRGQDGWVGELATSDLIPAVLNPHQLGGADARFFTIPKESKHLYLHPQPGKQRYGLAEYVRLGELAGVHQGKLVQSNGSELAWYRQVRSLVASEWVLPYNSAYDYGAWHNPAGAVLNGRFVGVDVLDSQYSNLVGAVLNSTFAAVGRLLEGVATGVEGAFDVGPPAARKIRIPDVRRFSYQARDLVLACLKAIQHNDEMLPAPTRRGAVSQMRRDLDTTLLVALGHTQGQAAAFLDRLYLSYGRWRANIEDVEIQMRANRRTMNATGVNRHQRPVESAGKRVWEELEHTLTLFPRALLPAEEIVELINVPATAYIPATRPLFEEGVIRTKTKAVDLKDYARLRYVLMLREIGVVGNIEVPVSGVKAGAIVDLFEKELRSFKEAAAASAAKYVSGKEAATEIAGIAVRYWFQACRKNALAPKKQPSNRKLN